jgi:hypothetical protein
MDCVQFLRAVGFDLDPWQNRMLQEMQHMSDADFVSAISRTARSGTRQHDHICRMCAQTAGLINDVRRGTK